MKTGRGRVEEVLWLKEWSHLTAAGVIHTLYSVNQIFTTSVYWSNVTAEFVLMVAESSYKCEPTGYSSLVNKIAKALFVP